LDSYLSFEDSGLYIFTIWKSIAYYRLCRDGIYFDKILVSEYKFLKRSNKANLFIALVKMYKDKEVNKNVKNIFLWMCDVKVFLTFTSLSLVLLWQLFYLFCSSIVINTVIVTAGTFESNKANLFIALVQ
jgi:hypothetical protein